MTSSNPIICALDTTDVAAARHLAGVLAEQVGAVKLGLEFFTANGAAGVREVLARQKLPLFLDLKFHDIPNTVAGAVRAAAGIEAFMMTVHAAGGRDMMRAAADAASEVAAMTGKARPLIVGVTVLTSMDQKDVSEIGVPGSVSDQVKRLAELARESGLDGIVCSPQEIETVRALCGADFTLVVPGIRPAGSAAGDQKRTMTPREAIDKGATYLVIGRPITGANDPAASAGIISRAIRAKPATTGETVDDGARKP